MENTEEMQELEEACKPIVEFLKKKHPYYSVTVDTDFIKLNETVIGVPVSTYVNRPKLDYISERITNISELENILEQLNIKAQAAKKSTRISDIQALISDIAALSESARNFEFRIERRTVNFERS